MLALRLLALVVVLVLLLVGVVIVEPESSFHPTIQATIRKTHDALTISWQAIMKKVIYFYDCFIVTTDGLLRYSLTSLLLLKSPFIPRPFRCFSFFSLAFNFRFLLRAPTFVQQTFPTLFSALLFILLCFSELFLLLPPISFASVFYIEFSLLVYSENDRHGENDRQVMNIEWLNSMLWVWNIRGVSHAIN